MILPYKGIHPKIHDSVFICEGAQVIGDVVLEKDVSVWFNAVIRGDVNYIRVGERTNVQDGCILHVTNPLVIGKNVTIAHGSKIHGCTVKDNILIGIGAILLDDCVVNSNSVVAAGTIVKENFVIPEGVMVAGVPGKIVRDIKEEEIGLISYAAEHHIKYVEMYRNNDKKN
jgi:carbonic anhydrase/acetyltransferase-like protein (isoleucine patch superfamily)